MSRSTRQPGQSWGVGVSGGKGTTVNLRMIAKIVAVWVVTPVVAALITIGVYVLIRKRILLGA
jgi:phosphate/sulfate permease